MRWRERVTVRIGDPVLVRELLNGIRPQRMWVKYIILLIGLSTGVVAVMNLQRPGEADGLSRKGIDVVLALDVSRSMLATDLPPNRLERAKQLITKLMNAMPDDRFALVVFAGKAYLQMPLTNDHGAAQLYVSAASPNAIGEQGTVISEALTRSAAVFDATERRFKAAIVISDGEDHDPEAVKTAEELAAQGMMISTVGIGSAEGSYIPDPATGENKKDETGSQVITKLNEQELKSIAAATQGVYVKLVNSDEAVAALRNQLGKIDAIALDDVSLVNFRSYYWIFAGLMFLALIGEFFIPLNRRPRRATAHPDKKPASGAAVQAAILLILFMASSMRVNGQTPGSDLRTGNELFRQGKYQEAADAFAQADTRAVPDLRAKYNRATALYRLNKPDEAIKELDDLQSRSSDPALRSKAAYNKGVILSGQQKLPESIEAYKAALRLDPADLQARENLQRALRELQQQQKQEKPKEDEKKQQKQEQQKQPQQQPKMNRQEAEQRLKLLEQKAREVQERLQQSKSRQGGGQQKDW